MAFNQTQKKALIDRLMATKRKAQRLSVSLAFQGKPQEATQLRRRATRLAVQIDDLLVAVLEQWAGNANTTLNEMKATNRRLQDAIRDIRRKRKVADRVVKALEQVDKAIEVARAVLTW